MSNYSEDDVRRAADIREWLVKQISDKQDEIDRLRTTLSIIDNLLKQGSFMTASSLGPSVSIPSPTLQSSVNFPNTSSSPPNNEPLDVNRTGITETVGDKEDKKSNQPDQQEEFREIKSLKRIRDNLLLANVELSSNYLKITPSEGIRLNLNTPPFRSFFLNRILEGMKTKDMEKVNQGQIKESESLNYQVNDDDNGLIKNILINNYREKERINEIFNTSTWVFTRMIEKNSR